MYCNSEVVQFPPFFERFRAISPFNSHSKSHGMAQSLTHFIQGQKRANSRSAETKVLLVLFMNLIFIRSLKNMRRTSKMGTSKRRQILPPPNFRCKIQLLHRYIRKHQMQLHCVHSALHVQCIACATLYVCCIIDCIYLHCISVCLPAILHMHCLVYVCIRCNAKHGIAKIQLLQCNCG
jgi:hypothetical protein